MGFATGGGDAGDVSSRFELPGDVPPPKSLFLKKIYAYLSTFSDFLMFSK